MKLYGKDIPPSTVVAVSVGAVAAALVANRFMALAERYPRDMAKGIGYAAGSLLDLDAAPPFTFSASQMALSVTLVAFVVVFVAFFNYVSKGTFRRGEEHGSSRFATREEMLPFGQQDVPMANVLLSRDVKLRYKRGRDFKYERNRNVIVFGGSGSGKTRGYVKPNLMQIPAEETCPKNMALDALDSFSRSFVVTDPKGMTRVETGHAFAAHGYKIKEINVVDWSSCMHMNPLKYIHSEEEVQSFVTCFLKNTTPPDATPSDPFWPNSERKFLEALINYVLTELPEADRNLPSVFSLLDMAEYDPKHPGMSGLDILMYQLETGTAYIPDEAGDPDDEDSKASDYSVRRPASGAAGPPASASPWKRIADPQPNHPAVRAYRDVMSGAEETIQSILISVKVRVGPLRPKMIEEKLRYDELELDQFGEQKMILYAVPHDQDSTYNFLFAMVIWQMLKLLSDKALKEHADIGGALPVGVDFILDEAGNFYIPDLQNTVATCRSRNIGLSIILQSNAQLKSRYKDDAATIVDNCDSLVFLGGKSQETNKELEELIGQQTVTTDNTGETKSREHSMSTTIAQHARALMQASEIAKMDRSDCLVFITGANPWLGKKYDITAHPMYDWVDPGHKGAKYKRGFNFLAYQQDKDYTLHDTELEVEAALSLESCPVPSPHGGPDKVPGYEVAWEVRVRNVGAEAEGAPARHTAFSFGGEFVADTRIAADATDGSAASRDLEQNISPYCEAGGLVWGRFPARSNRRDYATGDDVIEYNSYSRRYQLLEQNIEAGGELYYRFGYEISAEELDAHCAVAHAVTPVERPFVDLDFELTLQLHCATADVMCERVAETVRLTSSPKPKSPGARAEGAPSRGAALSLLPRTARREQLGEWGSGQDEGEEEDEPRRFALPHLSKGR